MKSLYRRVQIVALVLAGVGSATQGAMAQQSAPAPVVDPVPGYYQPGYYSPRLQAYFLLEETSLPSWPVSFVAARLVTDPLPGSPLRQAGLRAGDRIVRLDGTHVTRFQELNNHIDWTSLRIIRRGMAYVNDVTIYIPDGFSNGGIAPGTAPAPYNNGN